MKYLVQIPFAGIITAEIEAKNEKEAIKKALSECDIEFNQTSKLGYEIEEFEVYEKLVEGNVFNGSLDSIDVSEL